MAGDTFAFDWSDLAFGSKKPLNTLKATFIAAPREISVKRFKQLVKQYLPEGNLVVGIAKEEYVEGFDGQPQFRTLRLDTIRKIVDQVNASSDKRKVYVLEYFQRETAYLFEKLRFRQAVLVNGSWKYAFHTQRPYYALVNRSTTYAMVSPFCDEQEAREYERETALQIADPTERLDNKERLSEQEVFLHVEDTAKHSFDHTFQTGAVLGNGDAKSGYRILLRAYNKVVPYQTYAMHHGSLRERNFSPANDLNHYDTVHAEVEVLLEAVERNVGLSDTTLFINLLPCPTCARMLADSEVATLVYQLDHSDGYALDLLQKAGKTVRRANSV